MRNATLVWIAAVITLSVFLTALSRQGVLAPVESAVNTLFSPLQDGLRTVFSPATDFLTNVGNYQEIRDENQELREENERLNAELVRLRALQAESRDILDLAGVEDERDEFEFLHARVVGADPNMQREVLAIDLGSDNGIETGMVVVAAGGSLVGRVTKVVENAAWVTLISDTHSSVNAQVQESGARGVVTGQPDGSLKMELVPEGSEIQVGDRVVTSGLGGNYPRTLYVGLVSRVESTPQNMFATVIVEPAVRLNRLDNVLVITNFLPLALPPVD